MGVADMVARADAARHTAAARREFCSRLPGRRQGDDRIARALRALDQEGISGLADLWQAMLAELSTKNMARQHPPWPAPPDGDAGIVRTGDGVLVSSKKLGLPPESMVND